MASGCGENQWHPRAKRNTKFEILKAMILNGIKEGKDTWNKHAVWPTMDLCNAAQRILEME